MAARKPTWVCTRQANKVTCGAENPNRKQLCAVCGKRKPTRKKASHLSALAYGYEYYVEINGGEHCGLCFRTRDQLPNPARKLDRDHDHKTGQPRGLLCREDNRKLKVWITAEWVAKVAAYIERAEKHAANRSAQEA